MEKSNCSEKSQSFQDNVPDHGNTDDTITNSKACIPPRPPQRRKRTNQKIPQKKSSDQGSKVWYHFTRDEEKDPDKATCDYCKKELSAPTRSDTSVHEDNDMRSMAFKMMEKFDKYWSFNSKTNYLLFVAIVLDPHFKLEYVEFCFGQMYGPDSLLTRSRTTTVVDSLDELYHEYRRLYTREQDKIVDLTSNDVSHGMNIDECDKSLDFLDSQFAKRMESLKKSENASEIAKYLNDELIIEKKAEFDVLAWWKVNGTKFLILSKLAKDVLAIPVSTVSSEQAFSTGGRVIDSFRSSLTPKTVEALICAQNWLCSTPIDLRESLDTIEKLEEIEEDCLKSGATTTVDFDE